VVVAGRVAPALEDLMRGIPSQLSLEKALLLVGSLVRLRRRELRRLVPGALEGAGLAEAARVPIGSLTSKKRKRALVELMLSVDAELVVVDAGLADPGFREHVYDLAARRMANGALVVVSGHHVELLPPFADRVVYLRDGRVGAIGSRENVLRGLAEERTRLRDSMSVPPTADARMYLDFLRIAFGAARAEDALRHAAERAAAAGSLEVDWPALAYAAGIAEPDAQAVIDRLRAARHHARHPHG
jgi:ABC-2 type transport system ATP-binding protein